VVFTSDHGDLCADHGRHNKGNAFEGSAKVPFVLYYPGRVKPGTVVQQALGCVDFLPTMLSLLGCPTTGREEGRDASGFFLGRPPADWRDVTFFRSTGDPGRWLAAVTRRYKLVLAVNDLPVLFDLEQDPDEQVNLLRQADRRETVRTLAKELQGYCARCQDPLGEVPWIAAQIAWAVGPGTAYEPPALPAAENAPAAGPVRGRRRQAAQGRGANQDDEE